VLINYVVQPVAPSNVSFKMESNQRWPCRSVISPGWEAPASPFNFEFLVDTGTPEGDDSDFNASKSSPYIKAPKICMYAQQTEIVQTHPNQPLLWTFWDHKLQPFTLHSLMITSNSKFIEVYTSSSADEEDFVYSTTVKCYLDPEANSNTNEFSGDVSSLLASCRRLRLKFLSLKGSKNLKLAGIAVSCSGLSFVVVQEPLKAASTSAPRSQNSSGSTTVLPEADSIASEPATVARSLLASLASDATVMNQLMGFRSRILEDIGILMDIKLNPVIQRLSRIENEIKLMKDMMRKGRQPDKVVDRLDSNMAVAAVAEVISPVSAQRNETEEDTSPVAEVNSDGIIDMSQDPSAEVGADTQEKLDTD
jgi:hypothetical protein